jgi:hypothetical protein
VVFDHDGNGDKIWVIGGYGGPTNSTPTQRNDVWNSVDGKNWNRVRADGAVKGFPKALNLFSTVVYKDAMWIIGGFGPDWENSVYNSTDGKTWTEVRANGATGGFVGRYRHTSVVFDDGKGEGEKMWVIGGNNGRIAATYLSDVWSSTNGVTWTLVGEHLAAEAFSRREAHSSIVFNDGGGEKMWVIGGRGDGSYNGVWSSANGKDWTKVKNNNSEGFSARRAHRSVVFDSKMWMIAGREVDNTYKDDVWTSTNGVSWFESTATAGFSARELHSSTVFKDKLWVIGGRNANRDADGILNDIWSVSKD